MVVATPTRLVDEITSFLAKNPTPEQIISYRVPEIFEQRAAELLEINRTVGLSAQQREEMNEFLRMDHFMTMLKAKSRPEPTK